MVPVVPFSVFFAAIVSAQAPECYTYSDPFLALPGCLPPQPPPLTMIVIPVPGEEEWTNYDVFRLRKDCHIRPRLPPYVTEGGTLFAKNEDCTKPALPDWGEGGPFRIQHCLPGRTDICSIDEIPPRTWGREPSARAWTVLIR
jgi:hypothetical protein